MAHTAEAVAEALQMHKDKAGYEAIYTKSAVKIALLKGKIALAYEK
jgi:hypothetical protein